MSDSPAGKSEKTKEDVKQEATHMAQSACSAAQAATDAVREMSRKASALAAELREGAYETGIKARDDVARQVEAQPIASVLVAASLGLIAGALLTRR